MRYLFLLTLILTSCIEIEDVGLETYEEQWWGSWRPTGKNVIVTFQRDSTFNIESYHNGKWIDFGTVGKYTVYRNTYTMEIYDKSKEIWDWTYDRGTWIVQGDLLKLKSTSTDKTVTEEWLIREK